MATRPTPMLLIPGAWMGSWIWEDTVERLGSAGLSAHTLTLSGLEADATKGQRADVRLDDHVDDALRAIRHISEPLTVVGHSYSGLVAGMVADQMPELVVHTVIIGGFYPVDGRSLLEDWSSDPEERAAERADIEQAGMIWAPPPAEGVAADPGLTTEQARWLSQRLRPHPGHTILDPASMRRPIFDQPATVVADVGDGDPTNSLPANLADMDLSHWNFRSIPEGHWPMVGHPEELDEILIEAASR